MDALNKVSVSVSSSTWTKGEKGFLVFMALVLGMVTWLGVMSYQQAMNTEGTKRNGEQWVTWFAQESAKRFEPGYPLEACAGGPTATPDHTTQEQANTKATPAKSDAAAAPTTPATNTWGGCLSLLTTHTEFKAMRNPFTGTPPRFVTACDPSDFSMRGSMAIDKIKPNPPGSAIPAVTSPLIATDTIGEKLQLKITVCDKGSYPVKVAETHF
jgi:hypothetical protein